MPEQYCYPFTRKSLGDYYEMTWRCAKCGYCRNVFPSDTEHERFGRQCPPGERFKYEAYFASGRSETARRVIEGRQCLSERLRHILYTCTTCGACEEWCQATQWREPLQLEYAMRRHFVRQGGGLLPEHQKTVRSIEKNHNRLNRNNHDRLGWLRHAPGAQQQRADTVYFVGCRSSFNRTEIARSACELLTRKLGLPVAFLAEERCCGRPLLDVGEEDRARELMLHNVRQIQATGARRVVFTCAECFSTFSNLAAFGIAADFEPLHISQLLAERLHRGQHALQAQTGTVTFHDPCYLGRRGGVYDQPRSILAAIPGMELVEMPRNRKNAWCCGAGGGVQEAYPDYAQWIARERFAEVLHVRADLIVTACPGCKENLWGAAAANRVRILDIAELANMLIREE
jgi:Fe-S oxidoreductase